uniref:Thioredoxin domain-containing protein n=1 Tax=Suricata suricatta TaxID=37032 RepID=A0A673V904_SURSU
MVKQIESKYAFQEALNSAGEKLVVVDFSATWCGPCKMIKPFFHSLSEKYSNVVFLEVDVDDCQCPEVSWDKRPCLVYLAMDVASECEVKCMPTFQFFKKGQKQANPLYCLILVTKTRGPSMKEFSLVLRFLSQRLR